MLYVWLAVVAICLIVEFITFDLVSVWFILGGIVSMILVALGVELLWQLVAFIVISLLCLIFCRKPIMKLLGKNKSSTNADANIGKEFTLLTPISFGNPGTIKINDVIWNVIGEKDDTEISAGVKVEIVEIKGNKFIVKEK